MRIFLKIAANLAFAIGLVISLAVLSGVFLLSYYLKDANWSKLMMIDFGIILISILVFVLALGFREFLLSLIRVEQELEHLETEVQQLEKADNNQSASWRTPQPPIQPPDKGNL